MSESITLDDPVDVYRLSMADRDGNVPLVKLSLLAAMLRGLDD